MISNAKVVILQQKTKISSDFFIKFVSTAEDCSDQALMIALYITMDNFGTACNVTGDGAIALIVDKVTK